MSAAALVVEVQDVSGHAGAPSAEQLCAWAQAAAAGRARGELTIRIVGETESADLNSRYRGKQGPTNVLAFPSDVPDVAGEELLPFGDVVICAEVVVREAHEQGKPLAAHWAHMVVHGTLHLLGYDHETDRDAAVMESHERKLLSRLGFADPWENRGQTGI